MDKLQTYKKKRHFTITDEPEGEVAKSSEQLMFVIQKHDARRLHYDFRLEVGGVLKSWAVPKGPSMDPAVKRLAVATEDHPLAYADFEGKIPQGEYGGGAVIVWDKGIYRNMTQKNGRHLTMEQGLEHGHVTVWLQGEKVRGAFSLNRFAQGRQDQWLLVKKKDEEANPKLDLEASRPESVYSGATVEGIASQPRLGRSKDIVHAAAKLKKGRAAPMPERIEPMLAVLAEMPQDQSLYGFEYKWDGIRLTLYWDGRKLRLDSRNLIDVTFRWPELQGICDLLGETTTVLDGELVALDSSGKVSFSALSQRMLLSKPPSKSAIEATPVTYMLFDVLFLAGKDLTHLPYVERRTILESLKLNAERWQTPAYHSGIGDEIFAVAKQNAIEGVVAKELAGVYEPGRRSDTWLKIKTVNRQELVIGGWLPEKGEIENGVGALLMGYYDASGEFVFAGKVGTGFDDKDRQDLRRRLEPLAEATNPFNEKVKYPGVLFVRPELVAEIEFREWTTAYRLRHGSFKGLRNDKAAAQVVIERAKPKPARKRV